MARTTRTTGSRIRTRVARIAAIGLLAALAVLFAPGVASAAGVTPSIDCYRDNGDGTYDVVLAVNNPYGAPKTIAYGQENQAFPSRLQGTQPTTFPAGTVRGAWTVRLTYAELYQQAARWTLDGMTFQYSSYVQRAATCPTGTQLPADGNGTGTVVALGAAGAVGALALFRSRRRPARLTEGTTSTEAA
ncbi:hypothetical protein [Geodermatophilus sp. SYSU D01105]